LYRLLDKAHTSGSAKEDIVIRGGRYRLSVVQLGRDSCLWRLEDVSRVRDIQGCVQTMLPRMKLSSRSAVLFVNDACRALFGHRPKSALDVFGNLHPRNGATLNVPTADGTAPVTVAISQSAAGKREVYLIPNNDGADDPSGTRALTAEWDAIEDLTVLLLKISADGAVLASNREARTLLDIALTQGKRVCDMLDGLGRPIGD
jgi:two-component system cell cycle sensor histidine kinase/response regulator CckA